MTPAEETLADQWATSTYGTHPVAHIRAALDKHQVLTATSVKTAADGARAAVGGLVTHRQQPPTARGVVFLSLEDETGMVNVICPPQVWERHRRMAVVAPALLVEGRIERAGAAPARPAGPSTWSPPRCVRSGCLLLALPSPAATSAERRGL